MKLLNIGLICIALTAFVPLLVGCGGERLLPAEGDPDGRIGVSTQQSPAEAMGDSHESAGAQSSDAAPDSNRREVELSEGYDAVVASLNEQRLQEHADWADEHGYVVQSAEIGSGFEDLKPFGKMVGDASVVALGKAAYGSSELTTMSHRLTEYLVSEMGFDTVVLDAGMAEAEALNEYVQTGNGDPEALIAGLRSNELNSRETLELVEWLRDFNEERPGAIALAGYGFRHPSAAMDNVLEFLRAADPEYRPIAEDMYRQSEDTWMLASDYVAAVVPLPADDVMGKTLEVNARARSEEVLDVASGATMLVDLTTSDGSYGGYSQVYPDDTPRGTTQWAPQELSVLVQADTERLRLVFYVPGRGSAWFDDLSFKADGSSVDLLPLAGDFESGDLSAVKISGRYPHHVYFDQSDSFSGKQSLRLDGAAKDGAQGVPVEDALSGVEEVLEHMLGSRSTYVDAWPARDVDWAIQNARLVAQGMWSLSADRPENLTAALPTSMESYADNVAWLANRDDDSRLVLLSDSSFASRDARGVAQPLEDIADGEYLSVVLLTHSGMRRHIPVDDNWWVSRFDGAEVDPDSWTADLEDLPESSVETVLSRSLSQMLLVDVREADEADPAARWLTDPRSIRQPWAFRLKYHHDDVEMDREFDLLVFVRDSTPTEPLDTPLPEERP